MPTAPYDSLNTIVNAARVRLNDRVEVLAPVTGKLLDNSNVFTQTVCNAAYRKMQEYLADMGYTGLKQDADLLNIAAVANLDPISEPYISYAGYFDGTTLQPAPVLPQNLIRPYKLWERPHAANPPQNLTEMDEIVDGLPSVPKANWLRQWQWKNDTLYIPGALVATDIRMTFAAYLADFVDNSPAANTPWYGQVVPIMRCLDPFADLICREISIAREDSDGAQMFEASARAGCLRILNRDTAEPKSMRSVAQYQRMADNYVPNMGPDTQPVKR